MWLEGLLEHGTPLLGVCLGSQLVARAAGADVFRSPESEVGWYSVELTDAARADPVATSLPDRFDAFQWHHYTHTLPAGAVELARSRVCTQAFRVGNAWGVQFHPEVRVEQVEEWLSEDPEDVTDPERSSLRHGAASKAGTSSAAGFARLFWALPSRSPPAASRPATTRATSRGS